MSTSLRAYSFKAFLSQISSTTEEIPQNLSSTISQSQRLKRWRSTKERSSRRIYRREFLRLSWTRSSTSGIFSACEIRSFSVQRPRTKRSSQYRELLQERRLSRRMRLVSLIRKAISSGSVFLQVSLSRIHEKRSENRTFSRIKSIVQIFRRSSILTTSSTHT